MRQVSELPPKDSCKMWVNFESLKFGYDTFFSTTWFITNPNVVKL